MVWEETGKEDEVTKEEEATRKGRTRGGVGKREIE